MVGNRTHDAGSEGASVQLLKAEAALESAVAMELMTQDEVIKFLRLDTLGLRQPKETLRYLRRTRQIAYVKVCGRILFPRTAVQDYLTRKLVSPFETPPD